MNKKTIDVDILLSLEINDGTLPLPALAEYTGEDEGELLATLALLSHNGLVMLTPAPEGDTFTVRLTGGGHALIGSVAEYRTQQMMDESVSLRTE